MKTLTLTLDEKQQAELSEILDHAERGISEFESVHFTGEEADEKRKMIERWTNKIKGERGQWFIAIHLTEDCDDIVTAEAIKQSLTEMLAGADIGNWQITNIEKLPK